MALFDWSGLLDVGTDLSTQYPRINLDRATKPATVIVGYPCALRCTHGRRFLRLSLGVDASLLRAVIGFTAQVLHILVEITPKQLHAINLNSDAICHWPASIA